MDLEGLGLIDHGLDTKVNLSQAKHPGHGDGDKKGGKSKSELPDKVGGDKIKKDSDHKKAPAKKAHVNQFANWWETSGKPDHEKTVHDSTPQEIKDHDVYKDMIDRFLPQFTKDKALENERDDKTDSGIDHSVIGEEKEREGYYPNELDDEI